MICYIEKSALQKVCTGNWAWKFTEIAARLPGVSGQFCRADSSKCVRKIMHLGSPRISSTLKLLLFASLLFPVMGTVFEIRRGVLIHFPFALLMLIWIFLTRRKSFSIRYDWTGVSLITILMLLPIQYLFGRGAGILAGGYVVLCAIVLLNIFHSLNQPLNIFVSWIGFAYKFVLVMLLIEAGVVTSGMQPQLATVFSPEYRDYMSADIPRIFGLMVDAGGLNSIALDAQVAGMFSLSATIWFVIARNLRSLEIEEIPTFWLGLAVILLLFTITATVAALSILAIFMFGLTYFRGLSRWLWCALTTIIAAGIAIMAFNGVIFQRIFNSTPIVDTANGVIKLADVQTLIDYGVWPEIEHLTIPGFYFWAFASPIRTWAEVDWFSKLIGVEGGFFDRVYVSGDFGLAFFALQSGVIGVLVFAATVLSSFVAFLRSDNSSQGQGVFRRIGVASSIISVVFLVSMAHYSAAFTNSACIIIFSIHLALAFYCRYQVAPAKFI